MKTSPATSYVAATFHPTIGQLSHQSLSNAATPELGMIPQGQRGQCRLTHSQGDTNQPNQIPLGLIGLQQAAKPAPPKGQPLHTRSKQAIHSLGGEIRILSHSWPYRGQNVSIIATANPKQKITHIKPQIMGKIVTLISTLKQRKYTARNRRGD